MNPTTHFVCAALLVMAACGDDTSASGGAAGAHAGGAHEGGAAVGGSSEGGSAGATLGGGGEGASSSGGSGGGGGSFVGVDPLEGTGPAELVQGGFQFTEGPVYLAALGVLRFSDIPANTIYELDTQGDITPWFDQSQGTNGNAVAPNGDMVMCQQTARRIARSPADAPSPTPVTADFQGGAFNSPNDVIVRSDSQLYFTDPDYGLVGPPELDFHGVFRFDGQTTHLVDDTHVEPNGIALSPDETILYVSDSDAGGLYSYDVAVDGSTGAGTLLIDADPSDGMAVDDAGNLYLTTGAGVEVYRSDGTPWGVIPVAEQPANCAFGGPDRKTLFITARTGLYRVDLNVPGLP